MCGIAGYIGKDNFFPKNSKIKSCLKLMKLRGPEYQDFKKLNFNTLKILFCASRLSIIDISTRSNQPFEDEEGIITFNGEIYNFLELKKDLIKKKIKFNTKSDTEVLLKYLNYYGVNNLNKIHGMWSFAYYSKKYSKFFICRDKFGEKPLFYHLDKDRKNLIFGSNINYIRELSGTKFKIDEGQIINFLSGGFRQIFRENKTFFREINFIRPGELIEINENFSLKIKKYIKLNKYNPKIKNYNSAKKELKKKIGTIIAKSFQSDVPVAFTLSGGVDSSIIATIAKKKLKETKFYSLVNKDKDYVEKKNINTLIKKFNLNHEYIKFDQKKNNLKQISNLVKEIGYPLYSSNSLALNKISQKARKDGYKVLICGNGADEIFSGYYLHHLSYLKSIKGSRIYKKKFKEWSHVTKIKIKTPELKNIKKFEYILKKYGFNFEIIKTKQYFKTLKIKSPLKNKIKDIFIENLDDDLFFGNLPSQTHNIDSITMHNSVESRMPFLNSELYNFRNKISKNFLIKNGLAKYILRDCFKEKLPKSIIFDSNKVGFYLPTREIINLKSKKVMNIIFDNKFFKKNINLAKLKKKIELNILTQQDQKFIFSLINVGIFLKLYS